VYDEQGLVTGFDDYVYQDMDVLMEVARAHNIKLIPVINDYLMADGASSEGGMKIGEHPEFITDPVHQRAFFENAIIPFLKRYGNDPTIYAWEGMNEPELAEAVAPNKIPSGKLISFITELNRIIHEAAPGSKVTLGALNRQTLVEYWKDVGLDIYQFHYYNRPEYPDLNVPVDSLNLDLPVIVGELDPHGAPTWLNMAYQNGYKGGFVWLYELEDDAVHYQAWLSENEGRITGSLTPDKPVFSQHKDIYGIMGNVNGISGFFISMGLAVLKALISTAIIVVLIRLFKKLKARRLNRSREDNEPALLSETSATPIESESALLHDDTDLEMLHVILGEFQAKIDKATKQIRPILDNSVKNDKTQGWTAAQKQAYTAQVIIDIVDSIIADPRFKSLPSQCFLNQVDIHGMK